MFENMRFVHCMYICNPPTPKQCEINSILSLRETLQMYCHVPGLPSACGNHCRSTVVFLVGPQPVGNTADPLSCSWLVLSLWQILQIHCHVPALSSACGEHSRSPVVFLVGRAGRRGPEQNSAILLRARGRHRFRNCF